MDPHTAQKIKYVYSDPHFDSESIIKNTGRPFDSVKQMNEALIDNYNSVIKEKQTVCYWLGDVMHDATQDKVQKILRRLNGRKYLILGNHDRNHSETWWLGCGFEKVFTYPQYDASRFIMLSHEPLPEFNNYPAVVNVHGHIHNNGYDFEAHDNFINVSVEETDFKPVLLQNPKLKELRVFTR